MKEIEMKVNDKMIRDGLRNLLKNDRQNIYNVIKSLDNLELIIIDGIKEELIDVLNYIDEKNLVANLDFKSAFKED
jgi:hypothetical protein